MPTYETPKRVSITLINLTLHFNMPPALAACLCKAQSVFPPHKPLPGHWLFMLLLRLEHTSGEVAKIHTVVAAKTYRVSVVSGARKKFDAPMFEPKVF